MTMKAQRFWDGFGRSLVEALDVNHSKSEGFLGSSFPLEIEHFGRRSQGSFTDPGQHLQKFI